MNLTARPLIPLAASCCSSSDFEGQVMARDHAPSFVEAEPDPALYEQRLATNLAAATSLLRRFVPESIECEVKRSPPLHYRQRVGFGIYDSERADEYRGSPCVSEFVADFEGQELFYVYWDSGRSGAMVQVRRFDIAATSICVAMPLLLRLTQREPTLREGLRSAKFHTTLRGDQLLVTLVYGPSRRTPLAEDWRARAAALGEMLSDGGANTVGVIGRSRGVMTCVGRDHIIERGFKLEGDGPAPVYKQIEEAFSNPNGVMAVHTLNWLRSCAQDVRRAMSDYSNAALHLLELYCGNGNHTVSMASVFDRVLAVEVSSRLVEACRENLALNAITNVEVVRVDSGSFCRRIVRSRSWENRLGKRFSGGGSGLAYNFGAILVDPPRAGLDATTLAAVATFDHVMWISCNPETLCRDLELLRESKAGSTLEVVRYAFFDHFPWTAHVEVGVLLSRRKVAAANKKLSTVPSMVCNTAVEREREGAQLPGLSLLTPADVDMCSPPLPLRRRDAVDLRTVHIAVIGGGIGGLATALALGLRGIRATVFERDTSFTCRHQGYGLTIQQYVEVLYDHRGGRAVKTLGLGQEIARRAVWSSRHFVFDSAGAVLAFWGPTLTSSDARRRIAAAGSNGGERGVSSTGGETACGVGTSASPSEWRRVEGHNLQISRQALRETLLKACEAS